MGKTRYAINLLPLGGYVRIYGENSEDARTPDNMLSKPRWQQVIVLAAGVTFNTYTGLDVARTWTLFVGAKASANAMPSVIVKDPALTIVMVAPGSPMEKAGSKIW